MFCGETSIRASSHYGEVATAIKCRSWGCPDCFEMRQRRLASQCINGKPNRFITITCRYGEFGTKEKAAAAIAKAWRDTVKQWRRLQSWHKCEYIAVFEPTDHGWPHLHILWRGHWIAQQWLSAQMNTRLNSPIVDIRAVDSARQRAFYVSTYFSKAPERFGTSKRYWSSRNYGKPYDTDVEPAFPKGTHPVMVPRTIGELLQAWYRESKTVWQIKNRIFGWGELVNEETGEVYARPSEAAPHEWGVAFDDG